MRSLGVGVDREESRGLTQARQKVSDSTESEVRLRREGSEVVSKEAMCKALWRLSPGSAG